MADIIALEQDDARRSWAFYDADNAYRYWFYAPMPGTPDDVHFCVARIERLPPVLHREAGTDPHGRYDEGTWEHTYPIVMDEDAVLLLNAFRRRCNLAPVPDRVWDEGDAE